MKASDVRQNWSTVVNKVAREKSSVVIEKDGLPVAALISTEDWERLKRLDEQAQAQLFTIMESMREAFAAVPEDELEREIEKAATEVRDARRRKLQDVQPS